MSELGSQHARIADFCILRASMPGFRGSQTYKELLAMEPKLLEKRASFSDRLSNMRVLGTPPFERRPESIARLWWVRLRWRGTGYFTFRGKAIQYVYLVYRSLYTFQIFSYYLSLLSLLSLSIDPLVSQCLEVAVPGCQDLPKRLNLSPEPQCGCVPWLDLNLSTGAV